MSAPLQISVAARVSEFLTTFQLDGDYIYRTALGNLAAEGGRSLIIDYEHLTRFDSNLAASLLLAPKDLLPEFQRGAYDALGSINGEYASSVRQRDGLHIRFKGAMDQVPLREVRESVLNRLITVSGIILRASEIRLQPTDAVFTCSNGHDTHVLQEDPTRVRRPEKCEGCDETRSFELDRDKTKYVDIQILKIQELPEELPPGEIPQAFDVLTSHDQINKVRPGDRVVLTGIPESIPEYNPSVGRGTFKIQINCNHVEIIGKGPEQMEISEEEVEKIKQIAALPDAYLRLIKSIAPSIIGLQVQKEAMLLLLAGSPMIKYPDETQVRGNINILLVGDPGIAKSQMLRFAAQVSPRGMYASGKMSTAAGLSAAVVKDKNNVMSLEAGVVVLADQGIASIDEFEHLRAEDRSALHEMMEQQSYHPSLEVLLASGKKVKIGEYVDGIFDSGRSTILEGKDCQIVELDGRDEIYTFNFQDNSVEKVNIARVSRHSPPDHFVKIRYSNGRSILVTPEHPVYVYRDGAMTTVRADQVEEGDFVPAPRAMPDANGILPRLEAVWDSGRKVVTLPSELSPVLCRILGYLTTEGHFYNDGNSCEVGFSNTNTVLLDEMGRLMKDVFGIGFTLSSNQDGVLVQRYLSMRLYDWFVRNFPEMVKEAREKRIPAVVMSAPRKLVREFLATAFLGDGSTESEAICYRTASRGLAEDYQDLLLRIGVATRLLVDRSNDSFKVYITGDSLPEFLSMVVEQYDPSYDKIKGFVERGLSNNRGHDVVPTDVAKQCIKLRSRLGIQYDGSYHWHLKRGHGITRQTLLGEIESIEARYTLMNANLAASHSGIREIRGVVGMSQQGAASLLLVKRGTIDYIERGGYTEHRSTELSNQLRMELRKMSDEVRESISSLKSLLELRFLRVRRVESLRNEGAYKTEWVYDVTVEPRHNFICSGLVLHNTVTIAKGGFHATLNARTAIFAAANPILGIYDPYKDFLENVSLPPPLLTRFDLIYVMRDLVSPDDDLKLARHILDLRATGKFKEEPPVDLPLLKKYIAFAKRFSPKITAAARENFEEYYLKLRKRASENQIPATPRTLESLIRLATARARLLLRDDVLVEDAEAAMRLMEEMMNTVLVDTASKTRGDFGVLMGKSSSKISSLSRGLDVFKRLEKESPSGSVKTEALLQELQKSLSISEDEAKRLLGTMEREGNIWSPSGGNYKRIG